MIKKIIYIGIIIFSFLLIKNKVMGQNNVGIGTTTPEFRSILDLSSNDKGLLIPRLTTNQRKSIDTTNNAISIKGLLVYDVDYNEFWHFNGVKWLSLSSGIISGQIGPTGPTGANGMPGATGPIGFTGLAGINGATGATGPTGANGPMGPQGPIGVSGATGLAGINGVNGINGTNGTNGTNGLNGVTGPTGPSGSLDAWSLTGNSGANPNTNFIGTTDVNDFVFKTGGSNIINERFRIFSTGQLSFNKSGLSSGNAFTIVGSGVASAISNLGDTTLHVFASGPGFGIYSSLNSIATAMSSAIVGKNEGLGTAAQFTVVNTAQNKEVVSISSNSSTTGNGINAFLSNATNTGSVIQAIHSGMGKAATFQNSLAGNTSPTIYVSGVGNGKVGFF